MYVQELSVVEQRGQDIRVFFQYLQEIAVPMPGVPFGAAENIVFLTVVNDVKAGDRLGGAGGPVSRGVGKGERHRAVLKSDPAAYIFAGGFFGASVRGLLYRGWLCDACRAVNMRAVHHIHIQSERLAKDLGGDMAAVPLPLDIRVNARAQA